MEEDRELRRILATWQPPEPSARLDDRVMGSYRAIARPARWRFVLAAVAACVVVAVVLVRRGPEPAPVRIDSVLAGSSYETTVDSSSFRPVKESRIVVIPKGAQ